MTWCPRCGGPLADEVCENCISAETRRREGEERMSRERAKLWRWVERFAEVPSEQDPMSALLGALLSGATELHALFGPDYRIHVLHGDRVERGVSLPAYVVRDLALFLQHATTEMPVRDAEKSVITKVLVFDEHGRGVALRTELFVVEAIAGGYSVRLR